MKIVRRISSFFNEDTQDIDVIETDDVGEGSYYRMPITSGYNSEKNRHEFELESEMLCFIHKIREKEETYSKPGLTSEQLITVVLDRTEILQRALIKDGKNENAMQIATEIVSSLQTLRVFFFDLEDSLIEDSLV